MNPAAARLAAATPTRPPPAPLAPADPPGAAELAGWLAAAAAGDAAAFQQLHDRFYAAVARHAGRFLGDSDRAGDVAQEVFLALHHNLNGLAAQPEKLVPWLYRVARNRAVSERRREWRQAGTETDQSGRDGDRLFDVLAAAGTPDGLDPAVVAALRDCVAELPPPLREVVVLKWWEALSFTEVAAVVGRHSANVSRRHDQALAGLRDCLQGKLGGAAEGELGA